MADQWKQVFVTVGTTRFDKLVEKVLDETTLKALSSKGCSHLKIQLGSTSCPSIDSNEYGISISTYDYKSSISEDIDWAEMVIGHAGAGTTLEVLRKHKPLLVVINEDLMDNHQTELADRLQANKHLIRCDTNTLVNNLMDFDSKQLIPFPAAKPSIFADFVDKVFADRWKSCLN